MVTKHVFISGKVQGVYYRDSTREQADRLGITGWVRNLLDGRVEAVFQGPDDKVVEMIQWCWKGPPMSKVEDVEACENTNAESYGDFQIKHS
ncbi:MAG: acylphosphatase [Clostridiales bacterium]|nr:acylphosphatase [Clostridiales bacterium]MCF8021102.1 acylphosphatase [Clostridiales bacterium]